MTRFNRILAIDTSLTPGKIALCEIDDLPMPTLDKKGLDKKAFAPSQSSSNLDFQTYWINGSCLRLVRNQLRMLPSTMRTTRSLIPEIQRVLADFGWSASMLDLITTVTGPGSFTGLRIGVTTAKTLGYATGASVCGINSMELMALTYLDQHATDIQRGTTISTLIDAHRDEVFYSQFAISNANAPPDSDQAYARTISDFLKLDSTCELHEQRPQTISRYTRAETRVKIESLGQVIPTGSIVCCNERRMADRIGNDREDLCVIEMSPILLALLGCQRPVLSNERIFELNPTYFRQSAAEEKLAD